MTTYKPAGPVAKAFMMDDSFFRGIMGPFGSGKSTVCIMEILRRASLQQPGKDGIRRSRWAVIRNTYPELRTTTIKSWHQWVSPELGRWVDEGPPFHHIKMGDMDLEVLFVALDRPQDISKLLSMELTGAWVNEARRRISMIQTVLLPLPNGPMIPRKNESSIMNAFATGPAGLYVVITRGRSGC